MGLRRPAAAGKDRQAQPAWRPRLREATARTRPGVASRVGPGCVACVGASVGSGMDRPQVRPAGPAGLGHGIGAPDGRARRTPASGQWGRHGSSAQDSMAAGRWAGRAPAEGAGDQVGRSAGPGKAVMGRLLADQATYRARYRAFGRAARAAGAPTVTSPDRAGARPQAARTAGAPTVTSPDRAGARPQTARTGAR